ncbi:myrosinase 1-like [Aricia agestis]|uniref:myrosinase 1-like n=1 Tax=Aricia agestis TaxID=91739 RepID=UPI001C2096DB|nr:myrosinase 1-like [Aricia agestis]
MAAQTVAHGSLLEAVWCANYSFPAGFKFGAATAAAQVEGGWNVSDKSRSIWDEVIHAHPERVVDGSNGDVACDSYHLWKRDAQMAADLGLDFYRFSISWPRLLPSGFPNRISEDGRRFYSNLIDELIRNHVEPVITLYHFDLPQALQYLGGWTNPLVSDWFGEYARVVFSLFGDRVKWWITINEPLIMCEYVYNTGQSAPAVLSPGLGDLLCTKNALLAHAKAWRIYDTEFRDKYKGKISITNQIMWFEPLRAGDEEATRLVTEYATGLYTHPIFSKEGGWPKSIEAIVAQKSKEEGYTKSRLPPFTADEVQLVKGTYDFFGFNYYTCRQVSAAGAGEVVGAWPLAGSPDLHAKLLIDPKWNTTNFWFSAVPYGIRNVLKWIKSEYGNVEVYIAENGYLSTSKALHDPERVDYYKAHLEQILLAMYEDGVNVTGYTAWTLMDNFEWMDGYRSNFGLYAVDFIDPQRTRTPRSSAYYYAHVIRTRRLDVPLDYTPHTARASSLQMSVILLVCAICLSKL